MYLYEALSDRHNNNNPVRVALIGAGKFGSMFLSQVPSTNGLIVSVIADLDPERAQQNCLDMGWSEKLTAETRFTDDAQTAIDPDLADVVVEATGNPAAGIHHASLCIERGISVVMVNVEADALAGPLLAQRAREAGVVYSMAYGDQPALTCEMIEWARVNGFNVVAAGKGTRYLPQYHYSTPDTVWDYYGLTHEQAKKAGMNSQMFNSFLDGTKSALEMAAIANASGLNAPTDGLGFPPAGMDDLSHVLRPRDAGGQLEHTGQVEVVSSLERDGRPVFKDLRWGMYVVIEAPNDYAAACFRQYGMNTDESGRYSAMYKPFHLIGLELNTSILSAALLGKATGSTRDFRADVVAVAKRNITTGELLDGEGGETVWGKLIPASDSIAQQALPVGLAHHAVVTRDIKADDLLTWTDVDFTNAPDLLADAIKQRRYMEANMADLQAST